jgi:biopolymer transport protein ExbB
MLGRETNGARVSLLFGLLLAFVVAGSVSVATLSNPAVARAASSGGTIATTPMGTGNRQVSRWPMSHAGWAFQALGFGYSVIFGSLGATLTALFFANLIMSRRDHVVPVQLAESFASHLNEKHYREAYETARSDESVLGRVLAAGLAKVSAGYDRAVEAMQQVGEAESTKIEHRLSYLALIGTISPMVGLFGTVHGMISSFSVISVCCTQPRPSELAGGISTALFTTLCGLFIAIPAIASYNVLRNRIHRLVCEMGILSEELMSRFERVGGGTRVV